MRFFCALLTGALIIEQVSAQSSISTQANSTQEAADIRVAQQQQLENLIANAESEANRQRLEYQNQYAALQVQLSKCYSDKSIEKIQAQSDADEKKTNAQTGAITQAAQALPPLLTGVGSTIQKMKDTLGMADGKAQKEIENAVREYNTAARTSLTPSASKNSQSSQPSASTQNNSTHSNPTLCTGAPSMTSDGSNASSVVSRLNSLAIASISRGDCYTHYASLRNLAEEARDTIQKAEKEKAQVNQATVQTIAAAGQLGLAGYMMNVGKKGAESGLKSANQMSDIRYDQCADGIKNQAEELQRRIDALNAQLASDIDRLRKQFAARRVDIAPSNSTGLPVAEDTNVEVSELSGGNIGSSNFKSKNPLADLSKKNASPNASAPNGSGGSGLSGGEGPGWEFKDPRNTSGSDAFGGLVNQPEAGTLASGTDGGSGGPSAENPFGDPMMPGSEDPFANVSPEGAKQLTSYGNGFMELARQTHRRVYAHLGELLGSSTSPQITNKENKNPERTITSTKN
jgi:hypothetical protein